MDAWMKPKDWPLPNYVDGAQARRALTVEREVAFRDCDPMGVLWHGNYLAYCEYARNCLGSTIGLGLDDFRRMQLYAPIVRSQVFHHGSVRPGDVLAIQVALYPTAQPRLYHRYHLRCRDAVVCSAETEQVLTAHDFTLLLQQPAELQGVLRR
jgi:acyl-CoA thioester hydrolase